MRPVSIALFCILLISSLGTVSFAQSPQHQVIDTVRRYKFTEHQDVWLETSLTGRSFSSYWLTIQPDGRMVVKCSNPGGYAWDGCTPKWYFLGKLRGTPDGGTDPRTGKAVTYYASMVHDVLFHYGIQPGKQLPVSRHEADKLFAVLLRQAGFRWWPVYYVGVRMGGGFYGRWAKRGFQGPLTVKAVSWREAE